MLSCSRSDHTTFSNIKLLESHISCKGRQKYPFCTHFFKLWQCEFFLWIKERDRAFLRACCQNNNPEVENEQSCCVTAFPRGQRAARKECHARVKLTLHDQHNSLNKANMPNSPNLKSVVLYKCERDIPWNPREFPDNYNMQVSEQTSLILTQNPLPPATLLSNQLTFICLKWLREYN